MPIVDGGPGPLRPQVEVEPSAALELEWVLAGAERRDWRSEHATLAAVYSGAPDLEAAVQALWTPEESMSCGGFLELVVLAHHAGHLRGADGDGLIDALAPAAASISVDGLALRSESDDDRRVVLARLGRLRRSPSLRRHYVEVVKAAWDAARQDWERNGRSAVERTVNSWRRSLARGADWTDLADTGCFGDHLTTTVMEVQPATILVSPAYYTHKGLFVDLPGLVVVGVRSGDSADARARTEPLARQLKTLSDPTRLAILDSLRRSPSSVTELATSFGVSQPTVSNHVKVLRDAGLVHDVRQGRSRQLQVRSEAVDGVLGAMTELLAGDSTSLPRP